MKIGSFSFIGIALLLCAVSPANSASKQEPEFNMACGHVQSVGAPVDLSGTSQFFGVTLSPVKNYALTTIPTTLNLAVLREDKNAVGLATTLSAALSANRNVMVWWRPRDVNGKLRHNTVACVMIQERDCPETASGKCLGDE